MIDIFAIITIDPPWIDDTIPPPPPIISSSAINIGSSLVNRARTLLLNVNGRSFVPINYPGEEYVPPTFISVSNLPAHIVAIRGTLFGNSPDRAMMNYRLRQYMTILHSLDFEPYILGLDRRITYWPFDNHIYQSEGVRFVVETLSGDKALILVGNSPTADSQLYKIWDIQVLTNSAVQITRLSNPTRVDTLSYSITDGVSNLITFPGFSMNFYFQAGVGSHWVVNLLLEPTIKLADMIDKLTQNNSYDLEQLFLSPESNATFQALRSMWLNTQQTVVNRLGSVLLALVYRMNELWELS